MAYLEVGGMEDGRTPISGSGGEASVSTELPNIEGRPSKTNKRIFSAKGGGWGYLPFPLKVFGQDDFPIRGGGGHPPNFTKENSAKNQVF